MIELGYTLSSEEFPPNDLVEMAVKAEQLGFSFAGISDHFHPWVEEQGNSPFVWSVIGAVAARTERLRLGTGVTCPLIRVHPAIVAQAAATSEAMMPGRFFLGLGSGEALNEHITGSRWPPADVRLEMLEEAVAIIRGLWEGETFNHHGRHYTVEDARIFTLPPSPPPLTMAGSGPKSAELAGRLADGFWSTSPNAEVIQAFRKAGGEGKPTYGQLTACWAADEADARKTAFSVWPNAAVAGQLSQDLPTPAHFEMAAKMVSEDDVADKVVCGPDAGRWVESIQQYAEAGFTHVYLHQVGRDQEGFFRFWERELLPRLQREGVM